MPFTEEDAQNNGLIKREVGQQLKKVASRDLHELYRHFEEVCEHRGQDPADVLGEMVVKALEDEGYADRIFGTEVNLSKVQANEIRQEDIQYVNELAEQLGLTGEKEQDPIERAVMERINAATGTPLSGFSESIERGQERGQIRQYMETTTQRLEEIERKMEQKQQTEDQQEQQEQEPEEQDLDDIWAEDSPGSDQQDVEDAVPDEDDEPSDDFAVDEDELMIDQTGTPTETEEEQVEEQQEDEVPLIGPNEMEVPEDES
jgi:hypothetical protein